LDKKANVKLTEKQELFCQAKASGKGNKSAAIEAGFLPASAAVTASRMMNNAAIVKRISALAKGEGLSQAVQLKLVETIADDRQAHIRRLAELSDMARSKGQTSAAIRAEELIGRCLGFYVEQSVALNVQQKVEDAKPEEIREALAEAMERYKIGNQSGNQKEQDQQKPQKPLLLDGNLIP